MFHDSAGKIQKISSMEIMSSYDHNARFLESMEGSHEKIIDRNAKSTVSKQLYVMKYVLEALMEDSEEDGVNLTAEDIGSLFMLLKTEIKVLDNRA